MGERSKRVLDEGFSSYLLYLLRLFTAGLSPSLPPSFNLSDRQLLADSLCCCSLYPESPWFNPSPPFLHLLPNMLLHFTSLLSPPDPVISLESSEFSAIYSSGQKVKKVLRYMRTSVTSACNQSLFGLLPSLLAMCLCLSCHRLELNHSWEETEWIRAVY